jgi:hypothetical protein
VGVTALSSSPRRWTLNSFIDKAKDVAEDVVDKAEDLVAGSDDKAQDAADKAGGRRQRRSRQGRRRGFLRRAAEAVGA